MCGGPLTFIPALRKAFKDYLSLADGDIILPEKGEMLPALGAAMSEVDGEQPRNLADFIAILSSNSLINGGQGLALKPIFTVKRSIRHGSSACHATKFAPRSCAKGRKTCS